jgi:hypothetical protein
LPDSPQIGDFVEVRGRPWLVEGIDDKGGGLSALQLSCISDDAQGETLEVAWDAEIGARRLEDDFWSRLGRDGTDDPAVFAAYLRTLKWNTATAADRDLLQAPFRAGIRLDAYQLLPLRKALRLPRVNLLIADDVGLGKTIEAGLILRELLLRRRIDFTVVAAPPSMTLQWQDELEAKFGLAFTIIDRERVAELRRLRGFGVNPWRTGSRFIISHHLLTDETYVAGLRDLLGGFRPRALLILDEAHHAAPASGARYAIDSQFTKAIGGLVDRFEHRLFLTATPHNGHTTASPHYWRCSIASALRGETHARSKYDREIWSRSWYAGSRQICGASILCPFLSAASSRSCSTASPRRPPSFGCRKCSPPMVSFERSGSLAFRHSTWRMRNSPSSDCSSGCFRRSPPSCGPWKSTERAFSP